MRLDKDTPFNQWADFWRNEVGVNVIPADTKNKRTYEKWSIWQNEGISDEQHEDWKRRKAFDKGMAILSGKVYHRKDFEDYNLCFIDLDNQKAIDEVCNVFGAKELTELAQITIVEQHSDDESKAHVYFYTQYPLKKKSSDAIRYKDKINGNDVPAIEVKCSGDGIAYCTPSPHKDGNNYEIIGTNTPGLFEGKEIENLLFEIYKKYQMYVVGGDDPKDTDKIPVDDLFKPGFKILQGHNRHLAVLRVIESLYIKHRESKSLDKIYDESMQWNQQHCEPPLNQTEFDRQWRDGIRFVNDTANNSGQVLQLLKIENQENLVYKIVEHTLPYNVYYIDENRQEICYGVLKDDGKIYPLKSIIGIVPKRLKFYSNPLFPLSEPKVELEFHNGKSIEKIGPLNSLEDLRKTLEGKGYVLNRNRSHDAFNSIVSAMKDRDNGMVEYITDVTTGGYYLINEQFIKKNTTQSEKAMSKEDIIECCYLLNTLATTHAWKDKAIFPTVLKWGLIAPFAFIIKTSTDKWMEWLQLYGNGQTGKTTLGGIIMNIWNFDSVNRSCGFTNVDTPAKFGHFVSSDTYPKMVNEAGSMYYNKFGKYTPIIEMVKSSVESLTARAKFVDYKNYQEIPALSPLIFTSNYALLSDGSFNRRFISIHFLEEEKKGERDQKAFERLLNQKKEYLKVLGDFTMQFIERDPKVLLKEDWENIAKAILNELYKLAGLEVPEWIDYFVEQKDAIDEGTEKTTFALRSFLVSKINDLYSRHSGSTRDTSDYYPDENELIRKLRYCIDNGLVTFIQHKVIPERKIEEIIITRDIVEEINRTYDRIENITGLEDIGSQIGFKYTKRDIYHKRSRVLVGKFEILSKFLVPYISSL